MSPRLMTAPLGHRLMVDETGDGSSVPPVPVGTAALVWESTPGTFLPSDNLDAKSGIIAGGLIGSNLYTDGEVVNVAFTTAGGPPTVGQTVWLASSQDDSNTGRGKATATEPSLVMPLFPLFTQNIVPVGVCVANGNYSVDRTCQVRLVLPTSPAVGPAPVDQTFTMNRALNLLQTTSGFTTDGSLSQRSWQDGETIFLAFTIEQTADSVHDSIFYNIGAGQGWLFGYGSAMVIVNEGVALMNLGQGRPGLNIVCATRTGGNFRASFNGQAVVTMADPGTAPGASPIMSFDWDRGALCNVVKLTRALSDAELKAFSAWNCLIINTTADAPTNFFAPPPTLIADSHCQWFTDFTTWAGGALAAQAGPAGTGFNWTTVGAPTPTAFSYTWDRNPAPLFLDGPEPAYDSLHLSRASQLQRIAFTTSSIFDLALFIGAVSLNDTDNADESSLCIFVNGTPIAIIGAQADQTVRFSPMWSPDNVGPVPLDTLAGLVAPYHVELDTADKITRIDTYSSGASISSLVYSEAVVFETAPTSKRLVVLADGITMGGHLADLIPGSPASGAAVSRVRADYPGRVSAFAGTATQSLLFIESWGNGSMVPYADYVFAHAHEGSPASVVYMLGFGLTDWFNPVPTPVATFATLYGAFLDELHSLDPAASFAIYKPIQTALYPNLNINGDTLGQFATAVGTVAAARPWLTLIDLTTPNAIAFTGSPLAISPDTATGQAALKANIKAAPVVGY